MERERIIDMDSWHFMLYEMRIGCTFSRKHDHKVNRCEYVKEVLSSIFCGTMMSIFAFAAIWIYSYLPFAIFNAFMSCPEVMFLLTVILAGTVLSMPVIAIKRKLIKSTKKTKPFISFRELVSGYVRDVKKDWCPILTARRLKK